MMKNVIVDPYAEKMPGNTYTVRSVYFDSFNFGHYFEKIEGISVRKKVRTRVYNEERENSKCFLEIKRKYENNQVKNRASLDFSNLPRFLEEKDIEKYIRNKKDAHSNASRFLYFVNRFGLRPKVLVTYDREAYFSRFDSTTRITIDKNLRKKSYPYFSEMFSEDVLSRVMEDYVVLEVKFYRGFSKWIQDLIRDLNLPRMALSKYSMSIEGKNHKRKAFQNYIKFNKSILMN